jgi:hypothetical protein
MNSIGIAILTLIAGLTGGSADRVDCVRAIPRAESMIQIHRSDLGRSPAIGRRVEGSPGVPPWLTLTVADLDAPELDETWSLMLDSPGSNPIDWLIWSRPCSSLGLVAIFPSLRSAILSIPLRC